MGEVPMKGDATIKGFASGCEQGCELQQLYLSGQQLLGLRRPRLVDDREHRGRRRRPRRLAAQRATAPGARRGPSAPPMRRPWTSRPAATVSRWTSPRAARPSCAITSADLPESPQPGGHQDDPARGGGRPTTSTGASLIGTRTPMQVTGTRRHAPGRRQQRRPLRPGGRAARVRRPVHRRHPHRAAGRPGHARLGAPRTCASRASTSPPCAPRPTSSTSCAPTPSLWAGGSSCWSAC